MNIAVHLEPSTSIRIILSLLHCSLALNIAVHLVIQLYKKSYKNSNQAS
jgi:hypothetical protein